MSGMMHKISDAITGHHTTTGTNAAGTGAGMERTAMKEGADLRNTGTNSYNDGPGANMNRSDHAYTTGAGTVGSGLGTSGMNSSSTMHSGSSTLGTSGVNTGLQGSNLSQSTSSSSSVNRLEADKLAAEQRLGMNTNTTGMQSNTTGMTDNAMTRSEEHLLVGKEKVQAGTASLNKYVTTEKVSTAVPIVKERAVIEREPITDANRAAALGGPEFKEAHYEVNLTEERAVAEKEVVPIERVRLNKVVEQTQQYVEADLRKEHIEVVDGTRGTGLAGSNSSLAGDKTLDNSLSGSASGLRGQQSGLSGSERHL